MHAMVKPIAPAPGWQASLRLGFEQRGARTVLAERQRCGPLAVQRPFYPEGGVCHVYLLHPPGGVVGGDVLEIVSRVGSGGHALLTTPGAAKYYRSAGERARQSQRLTVEPGAMLEWLPQENILFPGARVDLHTEVDLLGDAALILWEIQCLGRPVIDEDFDRGDLDARLAVRRDGAPLLLERLRVNADNRRRAALMAGSAVSGSLLLSPAGERELAACRDLLSREGSDRHAAATLLDGLLVVRWLGESTQRARDLFTRIWQLLRPMTLGRSASTPRIWAT